METVTSDKTIMSNTCAVSLRNVGFSYFRQDGSQLDVLRNLSVTIPYGQIIGLIGRNGCGKTTLLEILRGNLVPQEGEVRVGRSLVASSRNVRQPPYVAIISQRPDAGLAPTMTVFENYALAAGRYSHCLRWAYSKCYERDCRDLLAKADMGIEDKCKEQTRFLSAGQQQALSVLLALQSPNQILLMDEPTASLDPFAAESILNLAISEIQRVRGIAILISHRLRDIADRCSRVLVLKGGCISRDIDCSSMRVTEQELLISMTNSFEESAK